MNFDLAPVGRILVVIFLIVSGLIYGFGYSVRKREEVKTKEPIKPIRIEINVIDGKPDTTYIYKQY